MVASQVEIVGAHGSRLTGPESSVRIASVRSGQASTAQGPNAWRVPHTLSGQHTGQIGKTTQVGSVHSLIARCGHREHLGETGSSP